MRKMNWNRRLASYYDSKINDVNGKRFCQNQQTSPHAKRYKRRKKDITTNLMQPDPTTETNKHLDAIGFILLSLLDEIHHSSYHVYFSIFVLIMTMIFRAAHSPQSAVLIKSNH